MEAAAVQGFADHPCRRLQVPYLVEWIEFHHLMGFTHLAIYDDGSHDNAHLIEQLYRQHRREYVSYDKQPELEGDLIDSSDFEAHSRMRRVLAAGACFLKYKHLADWIIHLDIDGMLQPVLSTTAASLLC